MAMSIGDIIQFTLEQSYLSQICNNVFFYEVEDITGVATYEDVNDAIVIGLLDSINEIQNGAALNSRIILKNLTNGVDIAEFPNTAFGDVAGHGYPSFVAWAFRLVRETALTRHGAKRFVGVSESSAAGNTPDAGILSALDAVALALASTIEFGNEFNGGVLNPVIVGRTEIGTSGNYELDLSKINPVASAQFIRISSQTTRRAGRGI